MSNEQDLSKMKELNTINSVDMKHHLEMAVATKVPVMFWGPAGVGKTQIIEQFTKEKNYHFIDFLLVIRDAVDIHGVPVTIENNGKFRTGWAIPEEIPMAGDKDWDDKIVVFLLDELTTASSETQAAALKMVNEHKLDSQPLHPNVRFVAAANPKGTRSHYNELLPPLKNRFKHYNLEAQKKPWVDHAIKVGMHPAIIGFIGSGSCSVEDFHIDNASASGYKKALEGNAFQTGRSWEFLSEELFQLDSKFPSKEAPFDKYLGQSSYGIVGATAASKFLSFYKLAMKIPTTDEICKGQFTKGVDYDQGQRFYITTALGLHMRALSRSIKEDLLSKGASDQELDKYHKNAKYVSSLDHIMDFLDDLDGEILTVFMCSFFKVHALSFDFGLNKRLTEVIKNNEELKMYLNGGLGL